jgi:hypothetical protein
MLGVSMQCMADVPSCRCRKVETDDNERCCKFVSSCARGRDVTDVRVLEFCYVCMRACLHRTFLHLERPHARRAVAFGQMLSKLSQGKTKSERLCEFTYMQINLYMHAVSSVYVVAVRSFVRSLAIYT